MKTYLVRALALAAVTAAVPASAATYVRNAVVDVSTNVPGLTYTNFNVGGAAIAFDVIPSVAVNDVITGTVTFSGGRVATLYDVGTENLTFYLASPGFTNARGAFTLKFNGLTGSPTTTASNGFSSAIGGCCVGPFAVANLTNSSMTFTGFDYTITMQTANSNLDAYVLSTTKISFADAPSAVPEPATWAMMALGFGAIGFAMRRRKVALATPFA